MGGGGIALSPEVWQEVGGSRPWQGSHSQNLFHTHCLARASSKPWGYRPREEGDPIYRQGYR